jgi:arylsulfatase
MDAFSPVTDDYDPWNNAFTGQIAKVTIRHKDTGGGASRALR